MTDRDEPDRQAGRWTTARRSFVAVGTIAGTALVGLDVTDVYGRLTDDRPEPLTVGAEGATDCPGGAYVLPSSVMEELPPWDEVDSDWARDNGGFDDDPTFYITIQGSSSESVIMLKPFRVTR